ncbi:hypothetical protein [Bovine papular stomatitis virus]
MDAHGAVGATATVQYVRLAHSTSALYRSTALPVTRCRESRSRMSSFRVYKSLSEVMISLFLMICYFVLIFNIIVPHIFEKLRQEEAAFDRLASAGSVYRCVDGTVVSYALGATGIVARVMTDSAGAPLPCARMPQADPDKFVRCGGGRAELRDVCADAYASVFL